MECMLLQLPIEWTEQLVLIAVVILLAFVLRFILVIAIKKTTRHLLNRDPNQSADDLSIRARRVLARASGTDLERHRQRVSTFGSLLRNVVNVVVVITAIVMVLSILGIPTAPLLASAGVGGVALGFGAQALVKDYLSGVFMLSEDQFGVGDIVEIGDLRGTVMEVTLRVTKLRADNGSVWYVRNGEILTLGNISQGYSTAVVTIPVAIDEDPERVMAVLQEAVGAMADEEEWNQVLIENPSVLGVDSMAEGTMTFQVLVKTGPNQQWGPMREVRRRASRALAEAGVRRPIIPGALDGHEDSA